MLPALVLLAFAIPAPVQNTACLHVDGYLDGPLVRDEVTARSIFRAIRAAVPKIAGAPAQRIVVNADATGWTVFEMPVQESDPLSEGGGGLSIHIDRCDGRVSSVYYQR